MLQPVQTTPTCADIRRDVTALCCGLQSRCRAVAIRSSNPCASASSTQRVSSSSLRSCAMFGQLRPVQPQFLSLECGELLDLQTLFACQRFPCDARHGIARHVVAQAGKILVACRRYFACRHPALKRQARAAVGPVWDRPGSAHRNGCRSRHKTGRAENGCTASAARYPASRAARAGMASSTGVERCAGRSNTV